MGKLYERRTHLCKEQLDKLFNKLKHITKSESQLNFSFTYWFNKAILNDLSILAVRHLVEPIGNGKVRGTLFFDMDNSNEFFALKYILEHPKSEKLFPYRFALIYDSSHCYYFMSNEGHDKFFPMQI